MAATATTLWSSTAGAAALGRDSSRLLDSAVCGCDVKRVRRVRACGVRASSSSRTVARGFGFGALKGLVESWKVQDFSAESCLQKIEVTIQTTTSAVVAGALILSLTASPPPSRAAEAAQFTAYYGTAASASSYGGYGGNTNKRETAEYTFEYPSGWKERAISKIEKGTNGTDSEFLNPRHKEEKVYVTYLAGFRRLAPMESVLTNLALSDPNLQDLLQLAEGNIASRERTDAGGQIYYDYEIDSPGAHALISVTCAKNKLYAHFVKAGNSDWNRDQAALRHVHESFKTVGDVPLAPPGEF